MTDQAPGLANREKKLYGFSAGCLSSSDLPLLFLLVVTLHFGVTFLPLLLFPVVSLCPYGNVKLLLSPKL